MSKSQNHNLWKMESTTSDSTFVEKNFSHSHGHHHHSKAGNKRKANRVQRACLNCRKRKQGCEEERPCRRCVEKGIECVEVETKRKKGRSKSSSDKPPRSRDHFNNEDHPDYEDDSAFEDESEEEDNNSSEDDQSSIISPRGASSNSSSSSENVIQTFTFKLNGSNPGSNSNLHHATSSVNANSHIKSNANSNVSLSNSNSCIPTLRERNPVSTNLEDVDDIHLNRGKESKRERPSSRQNHYDFADSSNTPDQDDDPSNESSSLECNYDYASQDDFEMPSSGINLLLLLPLIGNLCHGNDDSHHMMLDDEYNNYPNVSTSNSTSQHSFNNRIWSHDFSFYNIFNNSSHVSMSTVEESIGDSRSVIYLKECWEEFSMKYSSDSSIEDSLSQVNEKWKEIFKSLRSLDWQRFQSMMEELNRLPFESFGSHINPSIVCWTSGGRIHYVNESFCNLTGYHEDELKVNVHFNENDFNNAFGNFALGRDKVVGIHSIFHPSEMMKITQKQLDAFQHPIRSSFQLNTRLISKSQMEIPISAFILNLRDSEKLPLLTIAIFV